MKDPQLGLPFPATLPSQCNQTELITCNYSVIVYLCVWNYYDWSVGAINHVVPGLVTLVAEDGAVKDINGY